MRTTVILNVDEAMARFINDQAMIVDPSALINKLCHEDMDRNGFKADDATKADLSSDDLSQAMELHMDETTHAGG